MNVWTHYVFWDGEYPKGPDDIVCRKSQQKKRNETVTAYQESNFILDTGDYFDGLAVLNSAYKTNQVELNVNGFGSQYKYTILIQAAKATRSSVRDYLVVYNKMKLKLLSSYSYLASGNVIIVNGVW